MKSVIQTAWALTQAVEQFLHRLLPIADLAARIYVGRVFILSGWSKVSDWDTTLYLFRDEYHVPLLDPALAAVLASGAELCLPVLLVAGVFTQLSALGLFVLNLVAVASYYMTLSMSPAALADHLQWGIILALLLTQSRRVLALDSLLRNLPARD